MTEETAVAAIPGAADHHDRKERIQSSIQFPYGDLDTAVEVVDAIINKGGATRCSPDQLGGYMGQEPRSGNFRLKVSTARIFSLIETSPGQIEVTDLGADILNPDRAAAARAAAFLAVPLYKKVYEDWKGRQLPTRPLAFERMLVACGVSQKQKDKARLALDRSAEQAGFYEYGTDKLIAPNLAAGGALPAPSQDHGNQKGGGNRGGGDEPPRSGLDPLIAGLLSRLPKDLEVMWPTVERAHWLRALAMNLSIVYPGADAEIVITAKPPEK